LNPASLPAEPHFPCHPEKIRPFFFDITSFPHLQMEAAPGFGLSFSPALFFCWDEVSMPPWLGLSLKNISSSGMVD
jgi:hypothetical protein